MRAPLQTFWHRQVEGLGNRVLSVTVQAFLLCKSVVIQKGSRVADVNGVFDSITVSKFPATHESCAKSPSLAKRQIMDPNGKVQVICNLSRVSFAEEGIYTLQLRVNETTRSEFHVTVIERRAPRGA